MNVAPIVPYRVIEVLKRGFIDMDGEFELKGEKEEYAAAIIKLRKKYPFLYKTYKQNRDSLFAELTEGFNREMKRELRRIR